MARSGRRFDSSEGSAKAPHVGLSLQIDLPRVSGRDATLVVWSPDYDGKGKAWVRFDDGTDAIVGGSRVER